MTALAPASLSISAETSPVNAPEGSAWQSWAPIATRDPRARAAKSASKVAGGQTRISIPGGRPGAAAMIRSSSAAAALSPFIFQFPAISGRRRPFMPPSPGFFGLGQPGTRAGEATPAPYFHGLYANVARGRTCCGYVLRSL